MSVLWLVVESPWAPMAHGYLILCVFLWHSWHPDSLNPLSPSSTGLPQLHLMFCCGSLHPFLSVVVQVKQNITSSFMGRLSGFSLMAWVSIWDSHWLGLSSNSSPSFTPAYLVGKLCVSDFVAEFNFLNFKVLFWIYVYKSLCVLLSVSVCLCMCAHEHTWRPKEGIGYT